VCAVPGRAWGTASGLNNIPTADVVPAGVLVLQQFTNFGSDQETLAHLGFKWGPAKNWEIGLDKRIYASGSGAGVGGAGGMPAGPWVFQAKYRYAAPGGRTAASLGVANVGEDSDVAGDPFPYAVLSHDAGPARRADWIQANDQDDSVTSFGFIRPITGPWLIEGWISFPSESGVANTFTLKLDYVIEFGK
jgi:hypothetical protein